MQDTPVTKQLSLPARLRNWAPLLFVLLISITGALVAYPSIAKWQSASLTIDSERLRLAIVERGRFIRDVSVQGQVVAAVRPLLFSPEDGRVTTLVRSGDHVARGTLWRKSKVLSS